MSSLSVQQNSLRNAAVSVGSSGAELLPDSDGDLSEGASDVTVNSEQEEQVYHAMWQ